MEEALYEMPVIRRFVHLSELDDILEETTTLNFRRLLEAHGSCIADSGASERALGTQMPEPEGRTIVDATIIAAPSSTRNKGGKRDPEMHQTKKGNHLHFGMKAHIGMDE